MNTPEEKYLPFLKSLDELGFCSFKLFDDAEIAALKNLYREHFGTKEMSDMYSSHNSNPVEKSRAINNAIKEITSKKTDAVFPGYDFFIGHFVVKAAGTENVFSLHQDWNIVDERKFKSYQIWIPLQLTYPKNGGLFVLPGSHKFFYNYRSGSYGIPVIPFDENIEALVTNIIAPAGNVVAYQNGLFHGSHPNPSNEDRIAVIVNVVEKNAPLYFFQKNEAKNNTDLYSITGETLIKHLPQLEKGNVDASISLTGKTALSPFANEKITSAELASRYHQTFGNIGGAQVKQLHIAVNAELENKLNETGYAVIDLLSTEEVAVFVNEYLLHFGNIERTPGRFTTLQDTTALLKKQMHNFIVRNIDAPLRKFFRDFTIPVSQFYIKKAHTSGDIDIHADSTLLLNHQLEPHYGIWVALVNTDETNGTLTVIPHSHKIQEAFFASSVSSYHVEHTEWLRQFEVPVKLKAGQAVIFDNNLLHNSTANKTDSNRLSFTFRITHFASQYCSFFCLNRDEKSSIEVSEETHNYYMDENWDGNSKQITGKHIGTMQHSILRMSTKELEKLLNLPILSA